MTQTQAQSRSLIAIANTITIHCPLFIANLDQIPMAIINSKLSKYVFTQWHYLSISNDIIRWYLWQFIHLLHVNLLISIQWH